jgi:hypothetical protein
MTTGLDVLPGHTGICHRAPGFSDPDLQRVARLVEQDFGRRFFEHQIVMRIVPIVIDFRAKAGSSGSARRRRKTKDHVGEGVAMRLDTMSGYDGEAPNWLRDAEADMIVRQRVASEEGWLPVRPLEMVDSLLREQAEIYLRELSLDAGGDRVPVSRA